jgi:hypothetical protein
MHLTLDHPRLKTLEDAPRRRPSPISRVSSAAEIAALLTRLESITDHSALEVIAARDTFDVLHIAG